MAPQDPPYNPSPAPAASPAPPSYSHHDPNGPARPEAYATLLLIANLPSPTDILHSAYQQHPQPGYAQQPTYVTTLARLQDQPELVDCPFCHKQAMTRVAKEDSSMTMVAGGLLCLVCICLTCLPCMLGWCQNVDHYCSACGKQLTHKPHDGIVQLTEAAKEAQNRMGLAAGQQRGPAPGQVPSQYGPPPQMPQGEYGGQQQQQQYTGQSHMQQAPEIQVQSPPQSPPPAHAMEKA